MIDESSSYENPGLFQNRLRYLVIAVLITFLFLMGRTAYLQIIMGSFYKDQAESNRIRVVYIQPQRGLILDRRGELLANNVPSFNLYVVPEDVQDPEALLDRLSSLLQMDRADLERRLKNRKNTLPYVPVKIREGMALKDVALVESHRVELAGVQMEADPQRNYIHGSLGAHLLGYVGEASPIHMQEPEYADVVPGMAVGQSGIEQTLDSIIRGRAGERKIEVDAMGHEKKTLRVINPKAGSDVYLSIDLRLQKAAEEALGGRAGAIVALNPKNGEVLAMVSHPPFNPNQLSRSLSPAEWEAVAFDPRRPLTNRATQGQYPPGSTFKLVMSAAALETKTVTPNDPVTCLGGMAFGRRFYRDWKKGGHGSIRLHEALVQSCDVYYYEVGRRLGIDRISDYAMRFGLGQPTGIALASEKGGLIPTPEWKQRAKNEPWQPGETISASIGQGFITVTPLQMADLVAVFAVSGIRYQPQLLKAIRDHATGRLFEFPPVRLGRAEVSDENFSIIRKALVGVVSEPHGTGAAARSRFVTVGGKTGTAQVIEMKAGGSKAPQFEDHAWFIAFAPAEDPTIAVAVLVENGGHGGEAAAPLARRVIEEKFSNAGQEAHK
ncbi:MAG TPA: penicillin-binding protein 2 [Nitrospiria bacterium]